MTIPRRLRRKWRLASSKECLEKRKRREYGEMQEGENKKKQFSLSLLVRIFLAVIVVVSIAVFVNSVMRYNELRTQQEELEQTKIQLVEEKEELQDLADSKGSERYVIKMARKFWNLFFPNEEVYYNNHNS